LLNCFINLLKYLLSNLLSKNLIMKNAIKYGGLIGVLSAIWIFIMHFSGICELGYVKDGKMIWMQYAFVIIPFFGIFFGIKHFRDKINDGKMEFVEGLFEGFKIIILGAVFSGLIGVIYSQYCQEFLGVDYLERIFGIGLSAIIFNLLISLMLMNRQKEL
jgi:hypothetical protein